VTGNAAPAARALLEELRIAPDHKAFAGHFPGSPLLPGAALIDEALRAICLRRGLNLGRWRLASAKFLEPVRPGTSLVLEHSMGDAGTLRFIIRNADRAVASGLLTAVAAGGGHGP
jgi:3-hydroxymyristoyl/3-hydroxydecanoyl-(acyl carrier protein) dehydratase